LAGEQPKIFTDDEQGFDFRGGSTSDIKEPGKLDIATTGKTFCDVGHRGYGCAAQLPA